MVSSTDEHQPVQRELQNADFITLSFLPLLLYEILCKADCPSLSRATLTPKYSSFMKGRVCIFFLNSFLELPIFSVRSLWPTCINWWERFVLFPLLEGEISPLSLLSSCGWTSSKIATRQISRRKIQILICAHAGPIEVVPKWPKPGAFSLDKTKTKNNKFVRKWQDKEAQVLRVQLVKNLKQFGLGIVNKRHNNVCKYWLFSPESPAAAKSLQSCPTLCDPVDCSLPGSSIHGVFRATVLEWGAIAFSPVSPTSGYLRVSFYLQRYKVHLPHGRLISCFQGDRQEGQSVPLALAIS